MPCSSSDLGISPADYMRRLVERDLGAVAPQADPALVFDLGRSNGFDIAKNKDAMLAEAMAAGHSGKCRG